MGIPTYENEQMGNEVVIRRPGLEEVTDGGGTGLVRALKEPKKCALFVNCREELTYVSNHG